MATTRPERKVAPIVTSISHKNETFFCTIKETSLMKSVMFSKIIEILASIFKKKSPGKRQEKVGSRVGVSNSLPTEGKKCSFFFCLLLLRSHKRSSDDGWLVLYSEKENTWLTESKKRAQVTFEFHVTGKKPLPRDEKIQKCTFTNNRRGN